MTIKTKTSENGYDFVFNGDYYEIILDGKWQIAYTEADIQPEKFTKKKDLLEYIENYGVEPEVIEEEQPIGTWETPDLSVLLAIEWEDKLNEFRTEILDKVGLIEDGQVNMNYCLRHLAQWEKRKGVIA